MKAVQFQQEACAAFLLKCGADPKLRDVAGNTALHLAVLTCDVKVVGMLLSYNANIDAKNEEDFTPLSLAVSEGQVEIAEFLLKMGADVHARDQQQRTPLMMAASVGKMKLIKALLRYGADISHEDTDGLTANDYAYIYGYPSLSEQLAPKKAEAARAAVEDFPKGSLKRSEKKRIGDGWSASAEQFHFTPSFAEIHLCLQKQQEPKVRQCMKAFQQHRKSSSLPPMEEVEKADDFLWTSPWDSEKKSPEQHRKQEKEELAVELKTTTAGSMEKAFLNGSPDEPETTCRENTGEDSGSTFHVSSPVKKRGLKEATDISGVQSMQEALAQLQSESHLFHEVLEDMQEQQLIQGSAVTVAQGWFNEIFKKLSAAAEKQVYSLEERIKELQDDCTDLREQVLKYETDKVKREGNVGELQEELAEALKKLSVAEDSLEAATKRCRNLEEANLSLEKELEEAKSKRQELEEQKLQYEHQISSCMSSYKEGKRKLREKSQKLKDLQSSSSETKAKVKELEDRVQCLSMENARLEGTVQQQRRMIEDLEETLKASVSIHDQLEDLVTSLRAPQAAAEEQHQQQLPKQAELSVSSEDSRSVRKKRLKPRLRPKGHGSPSGREKNEILKKLDEIFWMLEAGPKDNTQLSEQRCPSRGGTRSNWTRPSSSCMQRSRPLSRTDCETVEPMSRRREKAAALRHWRP
ncbi:uncharacterized protein LRP34_012720 [Phaethornis superciliosus]